MIWQDIRDRVIADGIVEVREAYPDEPEKLDGALEGFAIAQQIEDPAAFLRVLAARRRREVRIAANNAEPDHYVYLKHRWATLQVEWVFDCMKVAWGCSPVSARAALKVNEVYTQLIREERQQRLQERRWNPSDSSGASTHPTG